MINFFIVTLIYIYIIIILFIQRAVTLIF